MVYPDLKSRHGCDTKINRGFDQKGLVGLVGVSPVMESRCTLSHLPTVSLSG